MGDLGRYLFHNMFGVVAGSMIGPYLIIYLALLAPGNLGTLGLILGGYYILRTIFAYPFGILSDKVGRKVPIFVSTLGMAYVLYRFISVTTIQEVYYLLPLAAFLGSIGDNAGSALFQEVTEGGKQGTKIASMGLVNRIVRVGAILAGGLIIQGYGFPSLFKVILVFELACGFTVFLVKIGGKPEGGGSGG